MMLDRTGTRLAVEERFGTGRSFDKATFLHLCEIYIRNEKRIYDKVMTQTSAETARQLIKHVVEQEAIVQDYDEFLHASTKGIICGVGGHIYYQPLLNNVTELVSRERARRKQEA